MDSNVFYRRPFTPPIQAVRGKGVFLFDRDGKEYIDGSGGALVVNAGHGNEAIADAISSQARKLAYVNGLHFTTQVMEDLASEIATFCPDPLNRVYTLSSGSAATEAVIKLARQYWLEKGKREKYQVIARIPGYHGNTLAALSASGRPSSRQKFAPLLHNFHFISAPMLYRCPEGLSYEELGTQRVGQFADLIAAQGSDHIAAFIAEPVIGASAGAVHAPRGYFAALKEICEENEILFVADEVLTGMGRTGEWLAIVRENVVPDILTLGKGLSSGYAPLSALVVADEIVETISSNGGSFSYNQTYSHTPLAAAAGLATIQQLKENALIERSKAMGIYFLERLKALSDIKIVGDVRGIGLFAGVEYVANRESRAPFDPDLRIADRIQEAAFEEGLVLWSTSQFLESGEGDLSVLGPPFVISEKEIDELVHRMRKAILRVAETIPA